MLLKLVDQLIYGSFLGLVEAECRFLQDEKASITCAELNHASQQHDFAER